MKAEEIIRNTDPLELRNIVYRLRNKFDRSQAPPLSVVVIENPSQYPPIYTPAGNGLDWINVKDCGAQGDGSTDDTNSITQAIAALNSRGKGVLYFPPGTYLTSGGFTISTPAWILGCGSASFAHANAVTTIQCNSATAALFTVSAARCLFEGLALVNVAGSTPSAGAGIKTLAASGTQRVDYRDVSVHGFYINIDIQTGSHWMMEHCFLESPVKYGVRVQNTASPYYGDWMIANCHINGGLYNADAAIYFYDCGGGIILNTNINGHPSDAFRFEQGIEIAHLVRAAYFVFADCILLGLRGTGIKCTTSSFHVAGLVIENMDIDLSSNISGSITNNVGNAIYVDGADALTIAGCSLAGGTTPVAMDIRNSSHVRLGLNLNKTFSGLVTLTSVTDVAILEPGTSVVTETSYGQSSAVGTSGYYSRQDHTHGSPSLSTATPAAVGATPGAGSGATPSKNDHVHQGVSSVNGQYGDVSVAAGAGQACAITRWVSAGGTAFDLPDVAELLLNVFDNGSLVDPVSYGLSSDRTQIVFDSSITATHIVVAEYAVAQV